MAAKKPAQSKAKQTTRPKAPAPKRRRRARHEGGLYKKMTMRLDNATGQMVPYHYWQASKDVAPEHLPPGIARKRITGTGSTSTVARERFDVNWLAYHSSDKKVKNRRGAGAQRLTVGELYHMWNEGLQAGAVSEMMASKYEGYFRNHLLPHIGGIYLDQLDEDHLVALFNATLPQKRKNRQVPGATTTDLGPLLSTAATRNIYMGLSNCLNYAVRRRFITASPLRAVRVPQRKEPTDDIEMASKNAKELLSLMTDDKDLNYCRWLLQFLGLRRAERLGLCWSNVRGLETKNPTLVISQQLARHVDGSGWYIKRETKTKRVRTIVLQEPFLTALRLHQKEQDKQRKSTTWAPADEFADLVFLQPNGAIYTLNRDNTEWHELLKRHKLGYWRAHLNRHITATWLAEQDPPMQMGTVFAILGHDSDAMGYYYAKTTEKQQAEPLRRYGQTLADAMKRKHSPR